MENTGEQQDTKGGGHGMERRKREAVRSDASLMEDSDAGQVYLEGALSLELGGALGGFRPCPSSLASPSPCNL